MGPNSLQYHDLSQLGANAATRYKKPDIPIFLPPECSLLPACHTPHGCFPTPEESESLEDQTAQRSTSRKLLLSDKSKKKKRKKKKKEVLSFDYFGFEFTLLTFFWSFSTKISTAKCCLQCQNRTSRITRLKLKRLKNVSTFCLLHIWKWGNLLKTTLIY